jgi:hypothetical protein
MWSLCRRSSVHDEFVSSQAQMGPMKGPVAYKWHNRTGAEGMIAQSVVDMFGHPAEGASQLIGRRVRKYLRTAKEAAAAAKCLSVCPLRIEPAE